VVSAVDVGVDQFFDGTETGNFYDVDCVEVPAGFNKQLIELFNKVLDSEFNAGLFVAVDKSLVPEIFEVTAFA